MASIIYLATYVIATIATFILAVYFLREYFAKRLPASLAWSIGFLLYGFGQLTDILINLIGEVSVGKPAIALGLIIVASAMTLFYYGTSQLFFSPKSFFREKMSVIVFLLFIVFYSILLWSYPTEGFRTAVVGWTETSILIIFLVISILFYRVSRRLTSGDPRRKIVFLVSAGWFLAAIDAFYLGVFQGFLQYTPPIADAGIHLIHAAAWLLILYGMAIGKAART